MITSSYIHAHHGRLEESFQQSPQPFLGEDGNSYTSSLKLQQAKNSLPQPLIQNTKSTEGEKKIFWQLVDLLPLALHKLVKQAFCRIGL